MIRIPDLISPRTPLGFNWNILFLLLLPFSPILIPLTTEIGEFITSWRGSSLDGGSCVLCRHPSSQEQKRRGGGRTRLPFTCLLNMDPNYYDYRANTRTYYTHRPGAGVIWFCPYKFISMQQFQQFMAVASKFIRSVAVATQSTTTRVGTGTHSRPAGITSINRAAVGVSEEDDAQEPGPLRTEDGALELELLFKAYRGNLNTSNTHGKEDKESSAVEGWFMNIGLEVHEMQGGREEKNKNRSNWESQCGFTNSDSIKRSIIGNSLSNRGQCYWTTGWINLWPRKGGSIEGTQEESANKAKSLGIDRKLINSEGNSRTIKWKSGILILASSCCWYGDDPQRKK